MSYFNAKMHQFDFDPAGGLQHSPRPSIAGFKGPTSKVRKDGKEGQRGGEGKGGRGNGCVMAVRGGGI